MLLYCIFLAWVHVSSVTSWLTWDFVRRRVRNGGVSYAKFKNLVHKPLKQRLQYPMQVENEVMVPKTKRRDKNKEVNFYEGIIGSDDCGMGAIAGPVVTVSCCCCYNTDEGYTGPSPSLINGVADSKDLSIDQCEKVYDQVIHFSHNDVKNNCTKRLIWSYSVRWIDSSYSSAQTATLEAFEESIRSVASQIVQERGPRKEERGMQKFYSIVDGHKSPSFTNFFVNVKGFEESVAIVSRPWKHADAIVYTVALASIIAKVIRHQIMTPICLQHPMLKENGGYPTKAHIAALHQSGVTQFHRLRCAPVRNVYINQKFWNQGRSEKKAAACDLHKKEAIDFDEKDYSKSQSALKFAKESFHFRRQNNFFAINSRRLFLAPFLLSAFLSAPLPSGSIVISKTGISLPSAGEIESATHIDWSSLENPIQDPKVSFSRLDSSDDSIFYSVPRYVEHVDASGVKILTSYVTQTIVNKSKSNKVHQNNNSVSVLDLCSSWTSHIDATVLKKFGVDLQRVSGLGMNREELEKNNLLTDCIVQDLNAIPLLPYDSNSFDLVFLQLSIDYLTKPLEVCREIARVLKSFGSIHVLFSNRLFLSKAVAIWTGADDIDHTYTVASYLHFSKGNFVDIRSFDLSVRNRNRQIVGDPIYVVTAMTKGD